MREMATAYQTLSVIMRRRKVDNRSQVEDGESLDDDIDGDRILIFVITTYKRNDDGVGEHR